MENHPLYLITNKFLLRLKERYSSLNFCYYLNEDIDDLVDILLSRFKLEFILKNRDFIRDAIINFFEPLYHLAVLFHSKDERGFSIFVKVLQKRSLNSDLIQELVPKLRKFRKAIIGNLDKSHTVRLRDEAKESILELINTDSIKEIEALKFALKEILDLDIRDIVIILKESIVIKKFNLDSSERRYNGVSKDDLKKLEDSYFEDDSEVKKLIEIAIDSSIEQELDFKEIDNNFFEDNYISIIQKNIFKLIEPKCKLEDKNLVEALSNYIFREKFEYALELLAKELIDNIIEKDLNSLEFLKYYSGGVFKVKDRRYKRAKLQDREGIEYSISYILSSISRQKGNYFALKKISKTISKLNRKILEFDKIYDKLEGELESKIEPKLKSTEEKLKDIQNSLSSNSKDSKESLNQIKDEITQRVKELNRVKVAVVTKLNSIAKQRENYKMKVTNEIRREKLLLKSKASDIKEFSKLIEIISQTLKLKCEEIN